ncbi:hypothetical protein [Cronobacter sakazakii]|uniref:hypothetical protein n=1 Tax=Cronobacter sakazakii TaxID=28141 RepID=UPI001F2E1EFE|nr:hypothetical protein [Cronobacter sakazakii]
MNNDELIAAGHELAKCLDSNTPLMDIAPLLSKMATQLDVTTAALREKTKQCEQLAAENAALKAICDDRRTFIMNGVQMGYIKVPTVETDPALETIRIAVSPQEKTPATDAFLREVRAQGVEMLSKRRRAAAEIARNNNDEMAWVSLEFEAARAEQFAAELRQGAAA